MDVVCFVMDVMFLAVVVFDQIYCEEVLKIMDHFKEMNAWKFICAYADILIGRCMVLQLLFCL